MPESYRNESPLFWPIVRLKEAYLRGDLSPVEVLEEAILRAEKYNPSLNAYLERLDEQARLQAKKQKVFLWVPLKEFLHSVGFRFLLKIRLNLKVHLQHMVQHFFGKT